MMMRHALLASVFAFCGVAANAATDTMAGATTATVVDVIVASADHTTLAKAATTAGLVDTLNGDGPFTVFAPTNAAFEALPAGQVDELMKPEGKDKLTKLLGCHVVASKAMAADVAKLITDGSGKAEVETVGGCKLQLTMDGQKVKVGGMDSTTNATVTAADLAAGNGVVHVIDGVLVPKM